MSAHRQRGKPDIVLISTADFDHPFWTNKQHTAVRLAARGYRVLYVESLGLRAPTTGARDMARMGRRLKRGLTPPRQVRPNLWVCAPLVLPRHTEPGVRRLNGRVLALTIGAQLAMLGMRTLLVWTYNPVIHELLDRLPHRGVVYHCVDDLTAAPGLPSETIADAERAMCARANWVFTTSPTLQDKLAPLNPDHTVYMPNVADVDHFVTAQQPGPIAEDLARIPGPRVGYIGAISPYKFDLERTARIARAMPDVSFVLIGQVGEGQPGATTDLLDAPNIHLLGPRPYDTLPTYLRGFDAALLPFTRNAYTDAMFPMKFFETLAAGVPVISTAIPSLKDEADLAVLSDADDTLIAGLRAAIAGTDPAQLAAGLAKAKQHTWDTRLDRMEQLLRGDARLRGQA